MPNKIEIEGTKLLVDELKRRGRNVRASNNKTFDLIVDGKYAEVKTKKRPFKNFDFLPFTDNQYKQIIKIVLYIIFLKQLANSCTFNFKAN